MCKKIQFKYCPSKIDKCMINIIDFLKLNGIITLACCCGHDKYSMSIICKWEGVNIDIISYKEIPRKKKFYKKDKQGYYYIPELIN